MVLSVPEPCSLYPRRGTLSSDYDGLRVVEKGALDENTAYVASHQFVWGLYLDELLVYDFDDDGDGDFDEIDQENGDKRYYALQDFIYSIHAVINSSGTVQERYDYQPYGAPSVWSPDYTDPRPLTPDTCPFLFTGQMYDPESGLYHFKARGFAPPLGALVQRDPLGYADGSNSYCYVGAAAVRLADPDGLQGSDMAARRQIWEEVRDSEGNTLQLRFDLMGWGCCRREHRKTIKASFLDALDHVARAVRGMRHWQSRGGLAVVERWFPADPRPTGPFGSQLWMSPQRIFASVKSDLEEFRRRIFSGRPVAHLYVSCDVHVPGGASTTTCQALGAVGATYRGSGQTAGFWGDDLPSSNYKWHRMILCPPWFTSAAADQTTAVLHELTHRYLGTVDRLSNSQGAPAVYFDTGLGQYYESVGGGFTWRGRYPADAHWLDYSRHADTWAHFLMEF